MEKNNSQNLVFRMFPAMQARNYQYFFTGQLISRVGTWLQIVSEGWLVLQLTNSAFLIGLVAACATLPSLLFSLFGGLIVDKFNKKKLIIVTQSLSMLFALTLAFLTLSGHINVWEIALFAFLLGVVNAIDNPARQAFVFEMVGEDKMNSAIALNSGLFNAARVVGPSVAGILIALVGPGGAYLINGISYIPAIIAQILIKPIAQKKIEVESHPIEAIKKGISYTWQHPIIRSLIILTAIVSIFGWSYTTIMPLIAEKVFHGGADILGYLYAAGGLGAVLATIFVSSFSNKFKSSVFINGGNTLFAVSMILFSLTSNLVLAYIFLFLAGFGLLSMFSIINARIQHLVDNNLRGRVMSLYMLVFVGFFPFGNFEIGLLSEHLGAQNAILIGVIIVLVAGIIGFFVKDKIVKAHQEYISKNEIKEGTRRVIIESNKP